MNKEFFRGMKELIEPDEGQVEELKNKLNNTAVVSRKPIKQETYVDRRSMCGGTVCGSWSRSVFIRQQN